MMVTVTVTAGRVDVLSPFLLAISCRLGGLFCDFKQAASALYDASTLHLRPLRRYLNVSHCSVDLVAWQKAQGGLS